MKFNNLLSSLFFSSWTLLTMTAISLTNLQAAVIECGSIEIDTPCEIPTAYGPRVSSSEDDRERISKITVSRNDNSILYKSNAKCSEIRKVIPTREAGWQPGKIGTVHYKIDFETDDYIFTYTYRTPAWKVTTWIDVYEKDSSTNTPLAGRDVFTRCNVNF